MSRLIDVLIWTFFAIGFGLSVFATFACAVPVEDINTGGYGDYRMEGWFIGYVTIINPDTETVVHEGWQNLRAYAGNNQGAHTVLGALGEARDHDIHSDYSVVDYIGGVKREFFVRGFATRDDGDTLGTARYKTITHVYFGAEIPDVVRLDYEVDEIEEVTPDDAAVIQELNLLQLQEDALWRAYETATHRRLR